MVYGMVSMERLAGRCNVTVALVMVLGIGALHTKIPFYTEVPLQHIVYNSSGIFFFFPFLVCFLFQGECIRVMPMVTS